MSVVFLLFAFPERASAADSFAEAARELAGGILAKLGSPDNVGFTFHSITSLGAQEVEAARRALENELLSRGVRFTTDLQTAAKIRVTLSENLQQYVWVAEIQRDQNHDLVMATQARADAPLKDAALRMAIQAKLIYEQNDPILDLQLLNEELVVLDPGRLALYRRNNNQWELVHSATIKGSRPLPRDPRGRFSISGDTIQVYLSGMSCSGTMKPAFGLECSQEETPWPLAFGSVNLASGRNYFVKEDMPAFYSASRVSDDGTELWIVAGTDGRTLLLDRALSQVGTLDGWGSDMATVNSGCGTGRQILAALPTDPTEIGAVQAFEILHRKAVAASSAAEFPGPITALWAVSNQDAAVAVSRDINTGRYAAFYLSISCSR